MLLLSSADFFFQNQLFRKILSGITSECQTVWTQIGPDVMHAGWVIFHLLLSSADFFSKSTFSKNSFMNNTRVSNSADPDQARRYVGPDLGPNCLQKLSAVEIVWE